MVKDSKKKLVSLRFSHFSVSGPALMVMVSDLCSFEACEVVLFFHFDWLLFLSTFLSGTPPVDKDIAFASGILIFEYTILPISVY